MKRFLLSIFLVFSITLISSCGSSGGGGNSEDETTTRAPESLVGLIIEYKLSDGTVFSVDYESKYAQMGFSCNITCKEISDTPRSTSVTYFIASDGRASKELYGGLLRCTMRDVVFNNVNVDNGEILSVSGTIGSWDYIKDFLPIKEREEGKGVGGTFSGYRK